MNRIIYSVIVSLALLAPGSVLAQGQNSTWVPIIADWWDENGLHGKTIYYNQDTGETCEPLPYKNGLPLCHDPLYDAGTLGNMCHDELDHDECEDGFIDRGFGCEPENWRWNSAAVMSSNMYK